MNIIPESDNQSEIFIFYSAMQSENNYSLLKSVLRKINFNTNPITQQYCWDTECKNLKAVYSTNNFKVFQIVFEKCIYILDYWTSLWYCSDKGFISEEYTKKVTSFLIENGFG
jgi:hypothetical protein